MSRTNFFLPAVFLLLTHCTNKSNTTVVDRYGPKTTKADGVEVPQQSIDPPQIIKVEGSKSIPAGIPIMVQLHSYSTPVGEPRAADLGTPTSIAIPGQGSYKLPEIIPLMDSSFVIGLPEVIEVKPPQLIDYGNTSYSVYNTLQGLKGNIILSMYADKVGNIWVGTWGGGVVKYDGRSFTQYSTAQGLNSDAVGAFLEDRNHNFWFGTYKGLCKFDGKYLTTFPKIPELSHVKINTLLETKNGNIWIGSSNGALKYDGTTFTKYTTDQGLGRDAVWGLHEDAEGNIWLGFADGYSKYDGQSFTYYESSKVPLWRASRQQGIRKYSFSKGLYKNDGAKLTHLGLVNGLNGSEIYANVEDQSSNLWIGSNGSGIAKSNGQLFRSIRVAEGLSSESIRSILMDRNGNIWIGTWQGGVNKYDGQSIYHYTKSQGLSSNSITAMCEDKDGNLWFGTRRTGIDKFDGKTFTNYSDPELMGTGINCMTVDRVGNIWLGTEGGVCKFDGNSFTNYRTSQGLSGDRVFSILQDKNNNMWFGTVENGLTKYDGKSFTHFNTATGLNDATVQALLEDKAGNIWLGTANGGVTKFDGKTFMHYSVEQGLVNNNVNSILEDKDGNLWLGTINGLSRMQQAGVNESTSYKEANSGISIFKNYLYADGFLGVGTWYNSLLQDKNGIIWAGTTDRITAYHKEEDISDTIPPHIQLRGVALFNEDINWLKVEENRDTVVLLQNGITIQNFKFGDVSKWRYTPEGLELAFDNNSITFKFIGITTNKPERVRYTYMLKGLDMAWSSLSANPEATYTNLSHGSYTFKVKAVNSEGYPSNELAYSFTIHPPWWFSIWAYIGYGLIFIAGIRVTHIYQKKRVIRMEQQKTQKKELEQAREIEKAYKNLKETQAQLIQSEKMASLGELTAGIAHEIQNPLNFVNNFSEVNKELIDDLIKELAVGSKQSAEEVAMNIRENEDKINQHGKRADGIVKSMLQHSRKNSSQKELTDINALCDEYLRLSYHGYRAKDKSFNAKFETDFDASLPKLNVVPQDIGRVILNLINNAFFAVNERLRQAQPDSGYEATVTVSTKNLGDKIEITVRDNGNGIPNSIKEKIFQPFFTTKPTGQGTGLGLSLSYDIVKAHSGEINVSTTQGEGASFIIQLKTTEQYE